MNTMSIYAQALISNREYKNARIDGKSVGVSEYRTWESAVKALRIPAYAVRVYRHNHMGDTEEVKPCDQSALYAALRKVLDLVGEVNGAKLDAKNCAEEIIAQSMRIKTIDTSEPMAHARCMKKAAKEALNENPTEANQTNYDHWTAEVKTLESTAGNCKKIVDVQYESTFVKSVELLLGDAISKQKAKSAEEVQAEIAAKEAERKAKKKAANQAKAVARKAAQN